MRLKRVEENGEVYYVDVKSGKRFEKKDLILNKEATKPIDETEGFDKVIKITAYTVMAFCFIIALYLIIFNSAYVGAIIIIGTGIFLMVLLFAALGMTNLIKKIVNKADKFSK